MASPELILELRRLINELDESMYTDLVLSTRLDAVAGDLNLLAGTLWREKAARFAGLIDVQEGNSSRKLSQLHSQALKMADSFSVTESLTISTRRPARTRQIERP